jgi:1-acyl-sn-glycerol-3-phosphate acyltransferase
MIEELQGAGADLRSAALAIARLRAIRQRLQIPEDLRKRLLRMTEPRRDEAFEEGAGDDYGLDLAFRERSRPLFRFLFENYWRVDVSGLENVPADGPVLLVGNHSGGLPFDATMVCYALAGEGGPGRVGRPLYDRFVENMGPIRDWYRKLGAVPARYAVADELLERSQCVVIFPEGVRGVAKLYQERYELRSFATSAARLAVRHRVAVVPFAVVGAEEIYPVIGRSSQLGKLLGAPYMPITPFFPLLGLAGLVPLPTKWTITFGPRIYLHRESRFRGTGATDFTAMSERMRRTVQLLLRRQVGRRSSIFLG